jgi:Domain of unknown function (DUF5666)
MNSRQSAFMRQIFPQILSKFAGLSVALLLMLLALAAPGCGGGGGVSGGGTGGGVISIAPAGGPAKQANVPISASAVTGLGSATAVLGDVAFAQAGSTVLAIDGLNLPAPVALGSQLSVLPATKNFMDTAQPIAQSYAVRAAVGVLQYDAQAAQSDPLNLLRINGQRILQDRRTMVAGTASLAALAGQNVAVYGYLDPQRNDIIATRIEALPTSFDLAGQQVITAQVQSTDLAAQRVSLGFAQLDTRNISASTPLLPGQWLNLRVRPISGQTGVLEVLSGQRVDAMAAQGELVIRGVVTSRPTPSRPDLNLVVEGYTINTAQISTTTLADIRLGSVVEVKGTLNGSLSISVTKLRLIANPIAAYAGEPPAPIEPEPDSPREDYRILDATIEQLNSAERSFVLRGQRIKLYEAQPAVNLSNGQRISVAGELRSDALGQFLEVLVLP